MKVTPTEDTGGGGEGRGGGKGKGICGGRGMDWVKLLTSELEGIKYRQKGEGNFWKANNTNGEGMTRKTVAFKSSTVGMDWELTGEN